MRKYDCKNGVAEWWEAAVVSVEEGVGLCQGRWKWREMVENSVDV